MSEIGSLGFDVGRRGGIPRDPESPSEMYIYIYIYVYIYIYIVSLDTASSPRLRRGAAPPSTINK